MSLFLQSMILLVMFILPPTIVSPLSGNQFYFPKVSLPCLTNPNYSRSWEQSFVMSQFWHSLPSQYLRFGNIPSYNNLSSGDFSTYRHSGDFSYYCGMWITQMVIFLCNWWTIVILQSYLSSDAYVSSMSYLFNKVFWSPLYIYVIFFLKFSFLISLKLGKLYLEGVLDYTNNIFEIFCGISESSHRGSNLKSCFLSC